MLINITDPLCLINLLKVFDCMMVTLYDHDPYVLIFTCKLFYRSVHVQVGTTPDRGRGGRDRDLFLLCLNKFIKIGQLSCNFYFGV